MDSSSPNSTPRPSLFVFNAGTTLLVILYSFSQWLFAPPLQTTPKCNIELLFVGEPSLEAVVGVAGIIGMFVLGPLIIWLVWNCVLHQKGGLQRMRLAEAYTVYLVLAFLSEFVRHTTL